MANTATREQVRQETRPKHAGVHQDQNRRHHSKSKRRTERQQLRKEYR